MAREMDLDLSGHSFEFQRNWFRNRNLATFREYIHPEWAGKPDLVYLEIGVFEGMSMLWMMQKILTDKGSRSVGIDPWLITTKLDSAYMEGVYRRAIHNLLPYINRCQLIRGNSAEVLRRMNSRKGYAGIEKESVDICMIDGDHNRWAVVDDANEVLPLMKPGGWVLFDDVENDRPKKNHVKDGLHQFLEEKGSEVRLLWRHKYMECYQRI